MSVRVVTAPIVTVVTLADLKAACRVEAAVTDDDAVITALGAAAQRQVEAMTQRRYSAQVLEWVRDGWESRMVLPLAPGGDCSKISVEWVKYYDATGTQQTLDPSLYWVRPAGQTVAIVRRWLSVWPLRWDGQEPVVIRFDITSAPSDAPAGVVQAIKMLTAHWYAHREAVVGVENRDSSTEIPFGVEQLIADERWS